MIKRVSNRWIGLVRPDRWLGRVNAGKCILWYFCCDYWVASICWNQIWNHIAYLLLSECHHHLTPSNLTSKLTALLCHTLSPSNYPASLIWFFLLWCVNLIFLLQYIILQILSRMADGSSVGGLTLQGSMTSSLILETGKLKQKWHGMRRASSLSQLKFLLPMVT